MEKPLSLQKQQRLNLVAGLQTQHREPCKDQTAKSYQYIEDAEVYPNNGTRYTGWAKDCGFSFLIPIKPRYQVGDRLYLQEPYQISRFNVCDEPTNSFVGHYLDDMKEFACKATPSELKQWGERKFPNRKTSGRMMYKSLARHWFEVTGVKAEQVQSISKEDVKAEGVIIRNIGETYWRAFRNFWDSIYGGGEFAWDRNPWVFAYTLRKV